MQMRKINREKGYWNVFDWVFENKDLLNGSQNVGKEVRIAGAKI